MKILIQNGNLHDGAGKIFEKTDLLVEDGKIIKIGKELQAEDACVLDASGKEVTPGFIDPVSAWGCSAGRGRARDNDEKSDPMTPHLNAYYAFDPGSMMYQSLWGYGITAAGVAPTNRNLLGGQMAVFKAWGKGLDDMLVKEFAAMKGSVNEQVKETYGTRNTTPMTRMAIAYQLQNALRKAHSEKEEDLKDDKAVALKPVIEGKMPLIMSCNTQAEIEGLIHCLEKENVELILANAYGLTKGLLNKECSIVLGDLLDGFSKYNSKVDFDALFALIASGKKVALSAYGDGSAPGREILLWNAWEIARQAAKHGFNLDSEKLLSMLTSVPAQMLHVEDRIGALKEGLDADLVIWNAHPLKSAAASIDTVLISGEIVQGGCAK